MEFFLLLVVFLLLALMGRPSVVVAAISFSAGTSMHVAMAKCAAVLLVDQSTRLNAQ
jgi:hypothetical protein